MYCINCGKQNQDGAQTCAFCGQPLVVSQAQRDLPNVSQNQPQSENSISPSQIDYSMGPQSQGSEFPQELNKFNWGAFLLTWIWGIGHGVWIALLALVAGFIPFLGLVAHLGFAIWLGLKGNELAWKTGKYNDIEKYNQTEKKWAIAGFVIVGISLLVIPIFVLIVIGSTKGDMSRASDSKRMADLARIQTSLEDCYGTNNSYPRSLSDTCVSSRFDEGTPKDPDTGQDYKFETNGSTYTLTASLNSSYGGNKFYTLRNKQ